MVNEDIKITFKLDFYFYDELTDSPKYLVIWNNASRDIVKYTDLLIYIDRHLFRVEYANNEDYFVIRDKENISVEYVGFSIEDNKVVHIDKNIKRYKMPKVNLEIKYVDLGNVDYTNKQILNMCIYCGANRLCSSLMAYNIQTEKVYENKQLCERNLEFRLRDLVKIFDDDNLDAFFNDTYTLMRYVEELDKGKNKLIHVYALRGQYYTKADISFRVTEEQKQCNILLGFLQIKMENS